MAMGARVSGVPRHRLTWLTTSRETARQYARWTAGLRTHPRARAAVLGANRWLKVPCYVLYPLLLALTWFGVGCIPAGATFWHALLAPVMGFALETALRAWLDAPRPYELLAIDPLVHKGTHGKSFPSRHVFSAFVIATCWLSYSVPVGCALAAAGTVLAVARVLGGVHFPRDVVAGAVLGIVVGIL